MTDKLANRSISDALPRTVKIEMEDEDDLVKVMADKYHACRCEFQLNYEQELTVTVLFASKDTVVVLLTGYGKSLNYKCLFAPRTLNWRWSWGYSCNFSVKKHHPGSAARDGRAGLSCR